MVECAVLVALASVLSVFKLAELPFGGSVTLASMLPIIIASYRHGCGWGLLSGFTFAVVQQIAGLKNLSYVTGWQSVVAVILLDYLLAFALVGLGGILRGRLGRQNREMALGAVLVSLLRYISHVVAGATVWKGLSIPDAGAIIYSLSYNATYMLPEALVLITAILYISSLVDFSRPEISRISRESLNKSGFAYKAVAGGAVIAAVITDTVLVSPYLQDAEGRFTLERLSEVNIIAVSIVSALALLIAIISISARHIRKKAEEK